MAASLRSTRCSAGTLQQRARSNVQRPLQAVAREEQAVTRRSMVAILGLGALLAMPQDAWANEAAEDRAAAAAKRKARLAALRAREEAALAAGPKEQKPTEYVETSRGMMEMDYSGVEERQRIAQESAARLKAAKEAEYSKLAGKAIKEVPPY